MQILENLSEIHGAYGAEFGFYPGVVRLADGTSEETERSSEV